MQPDLNDEFGECSKILYVTYLCLYQEMISVTFWKLLMALL